MEELPTDGKPWGTMKQPVPGRKFNVGEGIIQTVRWHMKQRLKWCGFVQQMVTIDNATTMRCYIPKAWVRPKRSTARPSQPSLLKRHPKSKPSSSTPTSSAAEETLPAATLKDKPAVPPCPTPHEETCKTDPAGASQMKDAADAGGVGGRQRGRRPVVVLLHAFGPEAMFHWDGQLRAFSRKFDVVMPDLVFFGKSTSTSEERSEVFQARCVACLMEHYRVPLFDVVGASYGGFVTYRLAQLYPDNVRRVVLTGCPGPVITWPDYKKILVGLEVDDWIELLVPETLSAMRKGMAITYYRPPSVPDFVLYGAMKVLLQTQVEEKRECVKALLARLDNPENPTPKIHQETLIVWGEHDRAFPLYLAERLVGLLGESAKLEVMKDLGHQPFVEKPKEYNTLVLDFLTGKQERNLD